MYVWSVIHWKYPPTCSGRMDSPWADHGRLLPILWNGKKEEEFSLQRQAIYILPCWQCTSWALGRADFSLPNACAQGPWKVLPFPNSEHFIFSSVTKNYGNPANHSQWPELRSILLSPLMNQSNHLTFLVTSLDIT